MSDLRKAAEMALNAMLDIPMAERPKAQVQAIQALRQALAQPEQKPVGYVTDSGKSAYFLKGVDLDDDTPLYTAPPKREWVGVTYDEVYEFVCTTDSYINLAKAIEAKLKEKNT